MRLIYRINRWLPFPWLPIARIKTGDSETATLRKDGWVIISNGCSTDALPISFCSQAIVDALSLELSGGAQ